jgi:hypothetical protein
MTAPQAFYGTKPIFFRRPRGTAPVLPELMRERGDVFLAGRMFPPGALMFLLRLQVSVVGVLLGLPGAFMPGQVVFFSVMFRTAAMGVRRKVTVLSSYLLRFAHNPLPMHVLYRVPRRAGKDFPRRDRQEGITPGWRNCAFQVQLLLLSRETEPSRCAFGLWAIPCRGQCEI